jgi:hypothetical protein
MDDHLLFSEEQKKIDVLCQHPEYAAYEFERYCNIQYLGFTFEL